MKVNTKRKLKLGHWYCADCYLDLGKTNMGFDELIKHDCPKHQYGKGRAAFQRTSVKHK